MKLESLFNLIGSDMQAVDAVIRARLYSDVVLVRQVAEYITQSGGKRLRPALVLLSAGAFGYRGTHHQELAAVIEFIHTATLLHDDVVDESDLRRWTGNGQCPVRQRCQRAGWRLPVFAGLSR